MTFAAAAAGAISTSADISFTAAGGNWGDVVAVGIFDAATAGNLLLHTTITTKTVNDGDTLTFASGNITVTLN